MTQRNVPVLVSVALLSRNGGRSLIDTLRKIRNQKSVLPFEIVIVDSGSTDGTLGELRRLADQFLEIPAKEFNFGLTRDLSFSVAKGSYIATLSQDAVPCDDHWLKNLYETLNSDEKLAAVSGRSLQREGSREFYWTKTGFYYFTGDYKEWLRQSGGRSLSNVNACYRRSAWEKVHFGPGEMGEDQRFAQKALALGYGIGEAPDACVFHSHDYNLKQLFLRSSNEAVGFRDMGIRYGAFDMLRDIAGPKKFIRLVRGILHGEVQTPAELLFPFLKPVWTYRAHRSTLGYRS